MDTSALRSELAERVDGEVRFDSGTRAVYAQDASNYRRVPIGVVVPRTVDAAVAAIAVCRDMTYRSCPGAAARAWRASAVTRP